MSHTPGPWFYIEEDVDHDGHYSEPTIVTECDGKTGIRKHIATVRIGLEGTEANGRLLAAAPKLLEAAELALSEMRAWQGECEWDETDLIYPVFKALMESLLAAGWVDPYPREAQS